MPDVEAMAAVRVLAIIPSTMLQQAFRAAPLTDASVEVRMFGEFSPEAQAAFSTSPTVIVVSSFLRPADAFATTVRAVQLSHPGVPVVAICPFRSREEVLGTIALGVAGCVCAEVGFEKVMEAILTVPHRTYLCPRASAFLREPPSGLPDEHSPMANGPTLTPRERQILRVIGEGSTDRQVARMFSLSVRTVNTHRANIMAKLGVHNATQLIRRATRLGLLQNVEP